MFWRGAPRVARDLRFGGAIGQVQRYRDAAVGEGEVNKLVAMGHGPMVPSNRHVWARVSDCLSSSSSSSSLHYRYISNTIVEEQRFILPIIKNLV